MVLLGSAVGSVHSRLYLLLLQGVSLTTLGKAKDIDEMMVHGPAARVESSLNSSCKGQRARDVRDSSRLHVTTPLANLGYSASIF